MKSTQLVAAVLAVLVVGAGAVAATPAASTSGQTATDALPGDDHAANESDGASDDAPAATDEADAEPGANAPVDVPASGASDRSLPEQASDTAKTVQSTIADWFGANESEREHDSLGDAISSVVGGDDADANESADDDADESADDDADASVDVGASASENAGANANATGQSEANANAEGIVNAVVSFFTDDDADA
ncbi:hypothetical protein [Halorubellus salinus]|uniref:hypothetical protein n=1 Tax=Halorubellus salinus TaxID=755309 RepID=UPI001D073AF5|nr:hypothetical protein [Halorubellus salinus]